MSANTSHGYLLLDRIAEGGMGYVELVMRREGRFERFYARKRLLPELRRDLSFRAMFMDEARLAGYVRHPNVVSVLDVGEDRDGPFLIMEYVEGVPASRLVAEAAASGRPIPVQIAARVALETATGLHAAHETRGPDGTTLGLVHRDVSPQNILVGFDGTVRVADFGIAKAFGNTTRTSTGILKGNVGYLSPEQLRFEEPDRRSDLFTLGVVLYELLAGERLYGGDDPLAGPRRILSEAPPDIGDVRADVPAALVELLVELLAKSPEARPPSAREVATRLGDILAAIVQAEGSLDLATYMETRFANRRLDEQREREQARRRALAVATGRRVAWTAALVTGTLVLAVGVGALWRKPPAGSLAAIGPIAPSDRTLWAGHWHSCAVDNGATYCWGKNNEGQLALGHTADRLTRNRASALDGAASVGLGAFHGCSCSPSGQVQCWGRNDEGQLGVAGPSRSTPTNVPGITDCTQVTAGSFHTCMLHRDRGVSCWGSYWEQRTAPGTGSSSPARVPGLSDIVQLDADGDYRAGYSCALRADGHVLCWGASELRLAGQAMPGKTLTDVFAVDGVADAQGIACGSKFACALRRGGDVACWGEHRWTTERERGAAQVPGVRDAVQIAAGNTHTCTLSRDGSVTCWGDGRSGQMGDGSLRVTPVPPTGVQTPLVLREIAVGGAHACGRHAAGIVCWGLNESGQIGDGTADVRPVPVSVAGFGR